MRHDWVTIFNSLTHDDAPVGPCGIISAPWPSAETPDCTSMKLQFHIVDAPDLSILYGDDVKIVQMVGSIYTRPVFQRPQNCSAAELAEWYERVQDTFISLRMGLVKQRVSQAVPGGLFWDPTDNLDWSDGPWLRSWHADWAPKPRNVTQEWYQNGALVGSYGIVTRNAYVEPAAPSWTLATGSGTWAGYSSVNVPAIGTTQGFAFIDSEDCQTGPNWSKWEEPGWRRWSLNSKRTIHLREEDDLSFMIGGQVLSDLSGGCGLKDAYRPCRQQLKMDLKVKLQYG